MRLPAAVVALALLPATLAAQGDARLQRVPYMPDSVTVVRVVPGFVTSVVLSPDERIVSVAVGNTAAWEVSPNKAADRLFIKASPGGPPTNVEVVTDTRTYSLMLQTTFDGDPQAMFRLGFDYPPATSAQVEQAPTAAAMGAPAAAAARYRITGDRLARPLAVDDDGARTRFHFAPSAAMPAVYALDEQGRETLVTLREEGGALFVDRVWPGYVLRLGNASARVRRVAARVRR